ncbi:MAG: sigma-70 family RNA polymerase sigma factor [Ktedonobacteraceae bacterium]|nr:sigma-70 family RNA polymerase sigma factor [Ktedonobacteraceae bacterium]
MEPFVQTVETLYTLYHRDIVRFFANHLPDRESAWDLCHEVFLRLLLTQAAGVTLEYPQRWLMRVAKNLLIDTYRQRASSIVLPDSQVSEHTMLAEDVTTFWELLERKEVLRDVEDALRNMPMKYRHLFIWREIECQTLQELTLHCNTTEAVLSTELWRARKLFQKAYLRQRFRDLLKADEEIFEHLESLVPFKLANSPDVQLQRIGTRVRDYFEQIAPRWDTYVASAYESDLSERLSRLLPWQQDMQVLDAGTGTGYLAEIVAPLAGEVIGVDCSQAMLSHASEKLAVAGHRHVTLREGTAERLPLASASVDVAMCHMLLHHVVSPRSALDEMMRVVRPGGYLLIIDANAHQQPWTLEEFGDVHYGTDRKKLKKRLAAAGMKLLQEEEAGISRSGSTVGRDAIFSNFLLLYQRPQDAATREARQLISVKE